MITQFSVGTSRTINLGNFESFRIEASVTYDVDEVDAAENFDKVKAEAQKTLRQLLEDTYREFSGDKKKVAK